MTTDPKTNLFDLTLLRVRAGAAARSAEAAHEGLRKIGKGELVGCWISEIGALNGVALIRSFESEAARVQDHALIATDPGLLQCGDALISLRQEGFVAAAGLPIIKAGDLGPFYEFRRYTLEVGGLAPTLVAWRNAIARRIQLSPLTMLMHPCAPGECIVHIWPYRSLDERQQVRGLAVREGIWPPKDSVKWIGSAESSIFMPTPFSPLR